MRKSLMYASISFLVLAMLLSPTFAWMYNDYPEPGRAADTKYETFGPRCDRMLIKLYNTAEQEWEALKKAPKELDITDWPLTADYYGQFTSLPLEQTVNVESVGGEFGLRNLDLNQNPNEYLGIPAVLANGKNPVLWKGAIGTSQAIYNPTSDLSFRQAVLSCINRPYIVSSIIGAGFAVEHWSMLPPAAGPEYSQDTFEMYPYSPTAARAYLLDDGFKLVGADDPLYRYWDKNGNNVEDDNEWVELKFVIRSDDTHRLQAGDDIADNLNDVGIRVNRIYLSITGARTKWMENKDAHLYTAGWSVGIEPDSITLWLGDAGLAHNPDGTSDFAYYWHPGRCYNTGYANDAEFNVAARAVEIAGSVADAVGNMTICNERAAEQALNGPMFVYSSAMANSRYYAGGTTEEEDYVGLMWKGMVMVGGYGSDSYFSFLNMHPEGYARPPNGTIRYGFKTTDIRSFSNLYAEWVWDNNVLDLLYDSVIYSNPYSLNTRLPWICKQYTVGAYTHPTLGPCTKVTVTLRNDVEWTDGTLLTSEDVYFTLVESWRILQKRGFPNPWYYSAVKSILSFSILDPMNFEILINVKSIWAIGLTGIGVRLLPEHIWRPIIESAAPAVVQGVAPDPNMISSGAWRLREYISTAYVDLVANLPGRTVKTSGAPFAGSVSITADKGFFRLYPKYVDIHADNYRSKILLANPTDPSIDVHLTVTDHNLLADQFDFLWPAGPHVGSPVGNDLFFEPYGCVWTIVQWIDGNLPEYPPDGMLSVCDMIQIQGIAPATPPVWVHVQNFPAPNVIHVGQVIEAFKTVYVDGLPLPGVWPVHEFEKPCHPIIETFTVNLARGYHVAKVVKTITTEWLLLQNNKVVPFPWITTITVEWPIYVTIKEDIAGSYYINSKLLAPDCMVDMLSDIRTAAKAFGSYPGHERWNTVADINGDYSIDMLNDIRGIAKKFGWPY